MGSDWKTRRLEAQQKAHKAKLAQVEGDLFARQKLPEMIPSAPGWIDVPLFDTGKEKPVPGLFDPNQGKATLARATAHARGRARFEFTDPPRLTAGLTREGRRVLKAARGLAYGVLVGAYEASSTGGPEPARRVVISLRLRRGTPPPTPAPLVPGGGEGRILLVALVIAAGVLGYLHSL
ncbi:MAG: hypothetical protein KC613_21865 [Myxococcales bacterium]|nr:hypothetical protein [Myxococcales bacterium]